MSTVADLLAGFPVAIHLPVQWGEMDSYRHVNNVAYFRYFESARVEYFRRLDWFEYEKTTGIGPILAATQARFRRALTYPDRIAIGTRVLSMGVDRFVLEHALVSEQLQAVATEGQGTVVMFDYHAQRKVPIPDELRSRLERLEGRRLS